MRDDCLVFDDDDANWVALSIRLLEALAAESCKRGAPVRLGADHYHRRDKLQGWLASRAAGRAQTTKRPATGATADDEFIDTSEAARRLGMTADAVAKRCRTGQFKYVARKVRGAWMVPAADIDAELDRRQP